MQARAEGQAPQPDTDLEEVRSARLPGRVRAGYLRAVDTWIPIELQRAGGEGLRGARLVVGLTLVLLVLAVETLAFFHWRLSGSATLPLDVALVLALSSTLLIPRALRRGRSIAPAANLLVGAAYLVLVTIFLTLGGIRAPVLHWCALLPMLAVLMGAKRSAWVWAGVAGMTIAGLATVEALDFPETGYLTESGLVGEHLWLQRLVDVGTWVGILFVTGLIYDRHKEQHAAELGLANAQLTREVGQRRKAELRTRYLAYYDELTALPNREFFKEQLEGAMRDGERLGLMVAVMFLDLDSFKEVNDSYGHRLGDCLLQGVAERLRSCVRHADGVFHCAGGESAEEEEPEEITDTSPVVSRLGGDEFTVLLVRLRNANEAAIVARRILTSFESPFCVEGHEIYISASIGIALHPRDGTDLNGLLRNADLAMYSAKDRGKKSYQFFTESMNEDILHRTNVASELRRAGVREELKLYYQPILCARTHTVVGVETLLRWQHPSRGLLLPGEFIEIAEESGLIVPISEQVLMRACLQNRAWQERGLPPMRIAVNVSGVQLRHTHLSDVVAYALGESELEAKYLELEITESAVMADEEEAGRSLARLKALGLSIALDDFGTGYSSLSYVQRYPVDSLKIDRSFVADVASDLNAEAITTAIIAMAHGLNLKVVAEGVETLAQERALVRLGCDELQGFRLGRPLPAADMTRFLERCVDGRAGEPSPRPTRGF